MASITNLVRATANGIITPKVRQLSCLDPRKNKERGHDPEIIIGQSIYAVCSGGACLSDSEALNEDPLATVLFGVGKFADQSRVGQWLREQSQVPKNKFWWNVSLFLSPTPV